jgi:hypothetical protein
VRTTGREMQLTRQIGEHLVAAELGRRGYVATPFAGNISRCTICWPPTLVGTVVWRWRAASTPSIKTTELILSQYRLIDSAEYDH